MTKLKLHNSDNIESINIQLCSEKTPIAYTKRVNSLVNSGLTLEDAQLEALEPIEMEMYYDENNGLFLVEAEAINNTDIFNPYTQEFLEDDEY